MSKEEIEVKEDMKKQVEVGCMRVDLSRDVLGLSKWSVGINQIATRLR